MVLEELRALRKEVRQLSLAVRGPQPNPTRPTNVHRAKTRPFRLAVGGAPRLPAKKST